MISPLEFKAEDYFERNGLKVHNFQKCTSPYPKWIADKLILKSQLSENKKSFRHMLGRGKPDLLVYDEKKRVFAFCEIKSRTDDLSYNQRKWFREWSDSVNCFVLKRQKGTWKAMGWEKGDELEFSVKNSNTLEVTRK